MLDLTKTKEFDNIIFVGDPHFISRQIGSRNDTVSTMVSFLDKWRQIAKLSNEYKALVISLGDFFDDDEESSVVLANELINISKDFYFTPLTLVGNHDITETILTNQNMLQLFINTGTLLEIKDNDISFKVIIAGKQVEIGGTHYGSKIPKKIKKTSQKTDKVVWITHHDLYFGKGYENMNFLHPIDSVDLAVNGHIHQTQNEIQHGKTTWCNPGNITRVSRDMEDHVPSVWLWNPNQHDTSVIKLKQIALDYQKNIFRKAYSVEATEKAELLDVRQGELHRLQFTNEALNYIDSNNATDDKEIVQHAIKKLAESMNFGQEFIDDILCLLKNID